jgi:antitoxin (DNA-binding transcriptional repressor) of toxin-antitoxin stability system
MKTIDLQETNGTSLGDLVRLAKQETEIVVTDGPVAVARITAISEEGGMENPVAPRKLGLHPGAMEASEDFDAPLPENFWLGKE